MNKARAEAEFIIPYLIKIYQPSVVEFILVLIIGLNSNNYAHIASQIDIVKWFDAVHDRMHDALRNTKIKTGNKK